MVAPGGAGLSGGGARWAAADTITVPFSSDPVAGATLYIANTSPTFTNRV
ncbi:hypothetical protein ACIG5E_38500 [Kitasatospora sp. NPDC053057]